MRRLMLPVLTVLLLLSPTHRLYADSNADVVNRLAIHDVYISQHPSVVGRMRPNDAKRLEKAVADAARTTIPTKIAIVHQYPKNFRSAQDAVNHLRTFLDFSGVLVLISPNDAVVSSDYLSKGDVDLIRTRLRSTCTTDVTACAIAAVRLAMPRVKAQQSRANRNVTIFWAVALAVFGLLIAALIWNTRRRQHALIARWDSVPSAQMPQMSDGSLPDPSARVEDPR